MTSRNGRRKRNRNTSGASGIAGRRCSLVIFDEIRHFQQNEYCMPKFNYLSFEANSELIEAKASILPSLSFIVSKYDTLLGQAQHVEALSFITQLEGVYTIDDLINLFHSIDRGTWLYDVAGAPGFPLPILVDGNGTAFRIDGENQNNAIAIVASRVISYIKNIQSFGEPIDKHTRFDSLSSALDLKPMVNLRLIANFPKESDPRWEPWARSMFLGSKESQREAWHDWLLQILNNEELPIVDHSRDAELPAMGIGNQLRRRIKSSIFCFPIGLAECTEGRFLGQTLLSCIQHTKS